MSAGLFEAFLDSDDTLRIYEDETLVFSSKKEQLRPLMEFIAGRNGGNGPVTIFDKVMGNAAALLAVKINCREVYSPIGSDFAVRTLDTHGIEHHLLRTVPYILRDDGLDLCPMERLSIGKEPEEFYLALRARLEAS